MLAKDINYEFLPSVIFPGLSLMSHMVCAYKTAVKNVVLHLITFVVVRRFVFE